MWKKESAILLSDGTSWTKIAGKSIPMVLTGYTTANQSLTAFVETLGLLSSSQGNINLVESNGIAIKRSGFYTISGKVQEQSGVNQTELQVAVFRNTVQLIREVFIVSSRYPTFYSFPRNFQVFLGM